MSIDLLFIPYPTNKDIIMKKLITLLLFGCLLTTMATAQNVVYNISPSTTNADPGATVSVDLTVENFVDMIGFQMRLEWDNNVLQFDNAITYDNIMCNINGTPNVCFSYPSGFGPMPQNITDFLIVQYFDDDLLNPSPNTIANGDKLLTLEFTVVGSPGQSSDIEFAGTVLAINAATEELSLANGLLSVNNGTFNVNGTGCAGAGDVTLTASDESGDTGTNGSVKVSVDNFDNIEGFGFTMSWDPAIISFDSVGNLNLAGLADPAPPAVGSFGTSQTSNGNLFVSWDNASGVTVCDDEVIFEIFYTVIGAGGSSTSVDFSNVEVIKNSLITPHQVNSGTITATGSAGPISGVGFIAGDVTGGNGDQVCVPFTVANFNQIASFQYEMTFDPSVIAFNSIVDGTGQPLAPNQSGNPLGLLNPAPPAVGNFGTTNTANGVISVSWDNASGVTLPDDTPIYEVCFDILGSAGESSIIGFGGVIEVTDVNGLADFTGVPGTVDVTGVFSGLRLEWDCCPLAEPNSTVCVDVRVVEGFDNILSMQYGMTWDPAVLSFNSFAFGNGNPLNLGGSSLVYDPNVESGKVLWSDNFGVGVDLADGTSLYQVCFDVVGNVGQDADLEMGPLPNAVPPFLVEVSNAQTIINFLGDACNITVENIPAIAITETITPPSCPGDSDAAIDVTVSGGVEDYTFAWSNSQTTEDISGLTAGTYTLTVTDCLGTTATASFDIDDPTSISVQGTTTPVSSTGADDGTITLNVTGGTGNYTSYLWNPNVGTTANLTGLAMGNYQVTVTDDNGCTGTGAFLVDNACNPITVLGNVMDVTCAGGNDGLIQVTASGGDSPYTYDWANGITPMGLMAGNYSVTATDVNGCTGTTTFTVADGANVGVNLVNAQDVNCFGENTGAITVQGTGGTGPYTYAWNPQLGNDATVSSLAEGTYSVTTTDANGCTGELNGINITQPAAPLNVVASVDDASCAGVCDGAISLSISGGTAGYTVDWSNGDTGTNVTGLCGGNITATVTDANGCTFSEVYNILQPTVFTLQYGITNESVAGGDGAINLIVTPAGNYSYSWTASNDPNFTSISEDLDNLVAGIYNVTVTDDASGCTVAGFAAVTNTLGIQSNIVTDVTCNGGSDGAIELVVVGGETPYDFVWDGPNGGLTTQNISGLTAGTYFVTIEDNLGEMLVQSYTINEPTAIEITNVDISDETDICNGAIDITVEGGNPPYEFAWNTTDGQGNPLTVEDPMGLCEGNYNVTITDDNDCFIVSSTYVVDASQPQIGNVVVNETSCFNECDGTLSVTIVGGNAPFTVTLTDDNNQPAGTQLSAASTVGFGGLCAGTYTVVVTDDDGVVMTSGSQIIEEPDPIQITSATIMNQSASTNPPNCDGGVNITVVGGTQPFEYQWSNGSTAQDLSGVCAGFYDVTITDANGCVFISPNMYEVIENIGFVIDVTPVACFGEPTGCIDLSVAGGQAPYTYEWENGSGTQIATTEDICDILAGEYSVMITDALNNSIFSGMINVPGPSAALEITGVILTQPSFPLGGNGEIETTAIGGTPPYQYLWEDENGNQYPNLPSIDGLSGGIYELVVVDANGCTTDAEFVLPGLEPDLIIDITEISCPTLCDGRITVVPSADQGGQGPHTYEWSTGESTSSIGDLCEGTYTITVTDDNGVTAVRTIEMIEPDPIQLTVNTFPGRADVIVLGGTPPYQYQWNSTITTDPFIENLDGGLQVLQVTDANGCQSEREEFVVPYGTDCLSAREVISPNEDGLNDVFYVNCVENQIVGVTIFNRWGQEVFQTNDYDNTWQGTGKRGEVLPEGGYFYVLEYDDPTGAKQVIKGALSIVRE
ncbi:MAG: gliding motility-associated C-terminal domain-containing protein [Bacteroidota bacterium]